MGTKTAYERNGKQVKTDTMKSFQKAMVANSTFEDKDELLDIV